jgi:hypothetical protein
MSVQRGDVVLSCGFRRSAGRESPADAGRAERQQRPDAEHDDALKASLALP